MLNEFSRTELLLGQDAMHRLAAARVAVFGIGGVGSFAAEAVARAGVGAIDLFDNDAVNLTNINRQLIATHETLGRLKVEVMRERILAINPRCAVTAHACFYAANNADAFDLSRYDYIIDAIDTVSSKLTLIERALRSGARIVSSMGAGNKLDPARLEVADLFDTSVCPLARVMRRELKKRGVASLPVVYSREAPVRPRPGGAHTAIAPGSARREVPGSVSFVPPVAGFLLASVAIRALAAPAAPQA